MKRQLTYILSLFAVLTVGISQLSAQTSVGINTQTPNPNAVLELVSPLKNQGLLITSLNDTERTNLGNKLGITESGLMIFNTSDTMFYFWTGKVWHKGLADLSNLYEITSTLTDSSTSYYNGITNLSYNTQTNTYDIDTLESDVSLLKTTVDKLIAEQNLASILTKGNEANNKIAKLTDPTDAQDAATKQYVDVADSSLSKRITANTKAIVTTNVNLITLRDSVKTNMTNIVTLRDSVKTNINNTNTLRDSVKTTMNNVVTLRDSVKTTITNVNTLRDSVKTTMTNVVTLRDSVKTNINNTNTLRDSVKTTMTNVVTLRDSVKTNINNTNTLRDSVKTTMNNVVTLRDSVKTTITNINTLRDSVKTTMTNVVTLRDSVKTTITNVNTLRDSVKTTMTNVVTLRDSVKTTITNVNTLRDSVKTTMTNVVTLRDSVKTTITNTNTLRDSVKTTMNNVVTLRDSVKTTITNINTLRDSVKTTMTNVVTLRDSVKTTITNVNTLRDSVKTTMTNVVTLRDSVKTTITNVNTLRDSVKTTMTNVVTLRDSVKTTITNINTLRDSVKTTITNVNTLRDSVKTTITNVTTLRDSVKIISQNIKLGKLNLAEMHVFVGDATDTANAVSLNGAIAIVDVTGKTEIQPGVIRASYLGADLAGTSLSNGTADHILTSNGDGTFKWTNPSTTPVDPDNITLNQGKLFVGNTFNKAQEASKNTIPLSGFGNATADVAIGDGVTNYKITNLLDPVANQDAATKVYVDNKIVNAGGSVNLTSAHLFVGSATGKATDVAVSGDVTLDNTGDIQLKADAVGATEIATDAVGSAEIATDAVTASEIATDAVTTTEILDGTIATSDVANDAITLGAKTSGNYVATITAGSALSGDATTEGATPTINVNVDNATVEVNASDNLQVKDAGITTAKISDNAITNAKMADNSVGTAEILNDNVTLAKIENGTATNQFITTTGAGFDPTWTNKSSIPLSGFGSATANISMGDGVTNNKITNVLDPTANQDAATKVYVDNKVVNAAGSVNLTSAHIFVGSAAGKATDLPVGGDVTLDNTGDIQLKADVVGATEIATDAVGSAEIAADAVTASEIATDAVTTTEILDGTVATNDIANQSITALKIKGITTAAGTTGQVLVSQGDGSFEWQNKLSGGMTDDLAGGYIWVGNGLASSKAAAVDPNGDVEIAINGTTTIQANAVTTAKILNDAVDKNKIAADVAGNGLGQNADGSIEIKTIGSTLELNTDAIRVATGGITANEIATGAVETTEILDGTIATVDIADNAITNIKMADNSVGTAEIINDNITLAKIENGTATNQFITTTGAGFDPTWTNKSSIPLSGFGNATAHISVGDGVTNYKVTNLLDPTANQDAATKLYVDNKVVNAAGSVNLTSAHIFVGSATGKATDLPVSGDVTLDNTGDIQIKADAVGTAEIATGAVTATEIATGAVETTEILDGTIATADIADNAITNVKLADDAVGTAELQNSSVTLAKMANMATASFLGRNTAGAGAPEVLSVATTKTMLSLSNVENTALSTWTGSTNITTLGTISTGTWNGSLISGQYGGTGVNNAGKTITLGGNLTTVGAFPLTLNTSAATNLTLPTSGTLATLAGAEALTNKTINGLTPTSQATGFTIAGGTVSKILTVSGNADVSGTNTGDVALTGENYLSISGQTINAGSVNLSGTNVTGTLAAARFPALTGDVTTSAGSLTTTVGKINGATLGTTTATDKNILVANGTQWNSVALAGDGTISNTGTLSLANSATARTNIGLGTASSPTFTGATLSGLNTKGIVTNTAAGVLGTSKGTGFLKDNGTGTLSYDNSTYLPSGSITSDNVPRWDGSNLINSSIWCNTTAGNTRLYLGSTSAPGTYSYNLEVSGTFKTEKIYHSSDARWKKNIQTVDNALDKVQKLRGVTYEWRTTEFPDKHFSNGTQIGLIAQEVEQVLPELVNTGADGYKAVEYSNIVSVLIEAIKEQQVLIAKQEAEIAKLQADVSANAAYMQQIKTMQVQMVNMQTQIASLSSLVQLMAPTASSNK